MSHHTALKRARTHDLVNKQTAEFKAKKFQYATDQVTQTILRSFKEKDHDDNGAIDQEGVKHILNVEFDLGVHNFQPWFDRMAPDENGCYDIAQVNRLRDRIMFRQLFNKLDDNGDRKIGLDELNKLTEADIFLSPIMCQQLMLHVDQDNDGLLSFDEFCILREHVKADCAKEGTGTLDPFAERQMQMLRQLLLQPNLDELDDQFEIVPGFMVWDHKMDDLSKPRRDLHHFLESVFFESIVMSLLVADVVLVFIELMFLDDVFGEEDDDVVLLWDEWLHYCSLSLIGFFCVEIMFRIVAVGSYYFVQVDQRPDPLDTSQTITRRNVLWLNILDFLVVPISLFLEVELAGLGSYLVLIRMWRIVRIGHGIFMVQSNKSKERHHKEIHALETHLLHIESYIEDQKDFIEVLSLQLRQKEQKKKLLKRKLSSATELQKRELSNLGILQDVFDESDDNKQAATRLSLIQQVREKRASAQGTRGRSRSASRDTFLSAINPNLVRPRAKSALADVMELQAGDYPVDSNNNRENDNSTLQNDNNNNNNNNNNNSNNNNNNNNNDNTSSDRKQDEATLNDIRLFHGISSITASEPAHNDDNNDNTDSV